jgi:hypothetical protein
VRATAEGRDQHRTHVRATAEGRDQHRMHVGSTFLAVRSGRCVRVPRYAVVHERCPHLIPYGPVRA